MSHPKIITSGDAARSKLMKGVTAMATAVKSTLGPSGKTVLIESQEFVGGHKISKDGVSVAESINFSDPIPNLAVGILKEAATRTASSSGDGTSTAIVLAEAILGYATKSINDTASVVNQTELIKLIRKRSSDIIDELKLIARPVEGDILRNIATISANNDEDIGSIISETYDLVGENGIVNVKNSKSSKTYTEITSGIKLDRGYTSNIFINSHKRDECILEKPYVLLTDTELRSMNDILKILTTINKEGRSLLIIGECSQPFLNTLSANVAQGNLKVCNIVPPSFGYKQQDLMSDLALSLNATFFSDKSGDLMNNISMDDLGQCERIVVGKDYTTIETSDSADTQPRIDEIKEAIKEETKDSEIRFMKERIALLSGSIGIIYVGGDSDIEQKELFDRVEDSVLACRSALEEGALPGGGMALIQAFDNMKKKIAYGEGFQVEHNQSMYILSKVVKEPYIQILKNADRVAPDPAVGVNAKTGMTGDMFEMGVIDPLKVTRTAFENAISVGCTLLSTSSVITIERAL